jgi:hypothetical protein
VFDSGRSGVWIQGKDAQVMHIENVNSFANGKRQIDNDGYGFYDASMLGNTYTACHTRNNYIAGYKGDNYALGAPNRSTYTNCYSEHGAQPKPEHSLEGPALLGANALVITSNGDGNLADAIGGASVIGTTLGRLQFKDVVEVLGKNGVSTITGDSATPINGNGVRLQSMLNSTAYGAGDVNSDKLFNVHDSSKGVRAWAVKPVSPVGPMVFGITDRKHLHPGLPIAPFGFLIGPYANKVAGVEGDVINDGARRIGMISPDKESLLDDNFPNALVGDVVYSSVVNTGAYNFRGWIRAFDSTGIGTSNPKWFRFGVNMLGASVPQT